MFDIEKIEINAAFYELFESVFGEDFFDVLKNIRPSGRIQALRTRATKMVEALTINIFTMQFQDVTVMK